MSSQPITQTIKAFINDVNLLIGKHQHSTEEEFMTQTQHDINHWHRILSTTGRELNIKKCF